MLHGGVLIGTLIGVLIGDAIGEGRLKTALIASLLPRDSDISKRSHRLALDNYYYALAL